MARVYETVLNVETEVGKNSKEYYHFHVDDAKIKTNPKDERGNVIARFRNFAGIGTTMNHEGSRNFMWEFEDPDIADELVKWGLPVKIYTRDDGSQVWSLKIRVKYRGTWNDPVINIDSDTAPRCVIPEECLGELDDMFFGHVDFTFTIYDYTVGGRSGRSAYLEDMLIYKLPSRARRSRYDDRHYGSYEEEE